MENTSKQRKIKQVSAPIEISITAVNTKFSVDSLLITSNALEVIGFRLDSDFSERMEYALKITQFSVSGKKVLENGVLAKIFTSRESTKNSLKNKFVKIKQFDTKGEGYLNHNNSINFEVIDNENPLYADAQFVPYTVRLTLLYAIKC